MIIILYSVFSTKYFPCLKRCDKQWNRLSDFCKSIYEINKYLKSILLKNIEQFVCHYIKKIHMCINICGYMYSICMCI